MLIITLSFSSIRAHRQASPCSGCLGSSPLRLSGQGWGRGGELHTPLPPLLTQELALFITRVGEEGRKGGGSLVRESQGGCLNWPKLELNDVFANGRRGRVAGEQVAHF